MSASISSHSMPALSLSRHCQGMSNKSHGWSSSTRSSESLSVSEAWQVIQSTVNFGYNDVPLGKKKKVAICEVSLYPKYTNYGIMYTCMYGCRILCMFYMHDMTYHASCTCTMSFTCAHVAVVYAGALR